MSSSGDRLSTVVSWLKHNASNRAAQVAPFIKRLPLRTITMAEMKFTLGRPVVQNNEQAIEVINEAIDMKKSEAMSRSESDVRGVPDTEKNQIVL